jgi:hypothetical protein
MKVTVWVLFSTTAFIAAASCAQGTTSPLQPAPSSGIDFSAVTAGFRDGAFWLALVATLIAGTAGGVVYELLILQGNIELPHKPTEEEVPKGVVGDYLKDLGIWARIIIGALAAVAAWFVITPSNTFQLVAMAVIAGSAGTSIFRSMQDRMIATLAQKDAANVKEKAKKQSAKVKEAREGFADLKKKTVETLTSPAAARGGLDLAAEESAALDVEAWDKVQRLLSEAEGIQEGV